MAGSFWDFNLGHVIELGVFGIAYLAYSLDRRKDAAGREIARDKVVEMHSENKSRLEALGEFHKAQQALNSKRDEQISQLATQTATLGQMAAGMERRLQMLEGA